MQISSKIVVILCGLWYSILVLEVCVAQQTGPIRNDCELSQPCNRTHIDVCATNGRTCKRFPSNCELQRENCNLTVATAWNSTANVQCSHLRINETGLCACSTEGLRQCSNETVTQGICTSSVTGASTTETTTTITGGVQACRLFRTECDLRQARCSGQDSTFGFRYLEWHNSDNRQCRGFTLNQSNPCRCPNLLQCSWANRTQRCVQVNRRVCRLYGSECDLESSRCDGEQRLRDVSILHCHNFQVNRTQSCHCPGLLNCQRNQTNICVRNTMNSCQLMANECDVEQRRCNGDGE
ncbi:uncharacterized protein LOC142231361 [Haematobia irritans]|uniref:uncharacterized protein LOC142231361 n=1 Tax=Haematobia irritans TaxID=7368 RepID=UPI003F4FABB8